LTESAGFTEMSGSSYRLARGTQVRQEGFGLLFYTMEGPRLYFLSSGDMLDPEFFESGSSLEDRLGRDGMEMKVPEKIRQLEKQLKKLSQKGVLVEC